MKTYQGEECLHTDTSFTAETFYLAIYLKLFVLFFALFLIYFIQLQVSRFKHLSHYVLQAHFCTLLFLF